MMIDQSEKERKKQKIIGHVCAASATFLLIISLISNNNGPISFVVDLLALTGFLLAAWLYSVSKGRSAIWFVLGFMGPIGALMVLLGPDFSPEHRRMECQRRSAEATRLAGLPTKMK